MIKNIIYNKSVKIRKAIAHKSSLDQESKLESIEEANEESNEEYTVKIIKKKTKSFK